MTLTSTIFILFMAACQRSQNQIDSLLINLSVFPDGWSVSTDGPSPIADAPLGGTQYIKSSELFFYVHGGHAYEEIMLFDQLKIASSEFFHQKDHIFRLTEYNSPWIIPDALDVGRLNADQYFYSCSQDTGIPYPFCDHIAQYGYYLVHFHTFIIPGYMDYPEFGKIIKAIDARMAEFGPVK